MAKENKKDTPFEDLSEEEKDVYIERVKRELKNGSEGDDDEIEEIVVAF